MHNFHLQHDIIIPTPRMLRHTPARRQMVWQELVVQSNGQFSAHLANIANHFPELTETELRICSLIISSLVSAEIAAKLGITEDTVENHRVAIRRKMGLTQKQNLRRTLLEL